MNFRDEEIKRQLRLGEDNLCEFKEITFSGNVPKSPRRDDLADELAAFANTDGGVILCGVTDSGDIQGMSREQMDALEQLLTNLCTDMIKPSIRPAIFRREIEEDKPFLLVAVPSGYALHDSPGGGYHRVGSTKRKMTSDERLLLAQKRGQTRSLWFDKQAVPGTGFGSLDESLWKPLLSAEGATAPELALEKMGLLTDDENGTTRATVAGVLLCTRSPEQWLPNACISATCYRGTDRASGQIDAQTITGPLNRQIAEAVAFAVRNMRVGAYKNPGRTDLPQYSEKALFEAIVNAVAHRDYTIQGSKIRLSMFTDRIEINSPGGLSNNLTIESMAVRQSMRNEALTSMLGRMSVANIRGSEDRQFIMERRGDGVPIIFRETKALSGESPEYQLIDGSNLILRIPAAPTEVTHVKASVQCDLPDSTLRKVDVLMLYQNNTMARRFTAGGGNVHINLPAVNLPMTVFVAAEGCAAYLEHNWVPTQGKLIVKMQSLSEGGSALFPKGEGNLPGLSGKINLIGDTYNRISLYTFNITINQGQSQPVHCFLGDDLHLTDANGRELLVRIVAIVGKSALLEYRPYNKGDENDS